MSARHEFHALWYGLGRYGRQDIHVHPCCKDGHGPNDEGEQAGCSEVLIGRDRATCTGRIEDHERANLEDTASVERAANRVHPEPPPPPMPKQGRWTLWMPEHIRGPWRVLHGPRPVTGKVVEVMPVAEHEAELQRVSEEYALQRAALVEALAPCTCPIGWGAVKADDCPRCNPKPQHTVSGARRP